MMSLRSAVCLIALLALAATSACRGASKDDEQVEAPENVREVEPNDTRDRCAVLPEALPLVGELTASDLDLICPGDARDLIVEAPSTVSLALVNEQGLRVELGPASGAPEKVAMLSDAWLLELRGVGEWSIQTPEPAAEYEAYCGIKLGDASAPVTLAFQQLPAEFPICVTENMGDAFVRFPVLRPDGVVGFDIRVDGLDASHQGALRVFDGEEPLAHTGLTPGVRLPSLRWLPQSELRADLQVIRETASGSVFLRIEPVLAEADENVLLELEPNDAETNAVYVQGASVVAGWLWHAQDIDRYRVAQGLRDLSVEVMTQPGTDLRVTGFNADGAQDAVRGSDGIYRLCSLGVSADAAAGLRVAYAADAADSDGVYQLTFTDLAHETDEAPLPVESGVGTIPALKPLAGFVRQPRAGRDHLLGQIFPPDDVDEWEFRLPEGNGDVSLVVRAEPKSPIDLQLRVLDADRVAVGMADRGPAGHGEALELELPGGVYFLEVRARGVVDCDALYELRIESPQLDARLRGAGGLDDAPQAIERSTGEFEGTVEGAAPAPAPQEDMGLPRRSADDDEPPAYPW